MRSLSIPIVLVGAAVLVAACTSSSSSSAASSTPSPDSGAALDGHAYLSMSVTGRDLVAGSRVRLGFQGGSISVNAGCNTMNGGYQVVDGKLKIGQMASTMMACSQPLMDQDTWLAAFLPGAAVKLDGSTLTLSKDGVVLTLTDVKVANPDRPLEGTMWVVDGIVANNGVSSVPAGVTATLVFTNIAVAVDTGCNTGSGSATHTDATITFGAIALTMKACQGDAATVEKAVTAALTGDQPYSIDGDKLKIGGDGKDGLRLTAGS